MALPLVGSGTDWYGTACWDLATIGLDLQPSPYASGREGVGRRPAIRASREVLARINVA